MMKKILIGAFLASAVILSGCEQISKEADKATSDAMKAYESASQQMENTKKQAIDAKAKVDEKLTQAQQAADAIKKLGE